MIMRKMRKNCEGEETKDDDDEQCKLEEEFANKLEMRLIPLMKRP